MGRNKWGSGVMVGGEVDEGGKMRRAYRVIRDCEVGVSGSWVVYEGERYWEGERGAGLRRAVVRGEVYPEYEVGEKYEVAVEEMVGIFEGVSGGEAMNRLYNLVYNLGVGYPNQERYEAAAGAIESCVRRRYV